MTRAGTFLDYSTVIMIDFSLRRTRGATAEQDGWKVWVTEVKVSIPETNIAPEHMPSQKDGSLPIINLRLLCFREDRWSQRIVDNFQGSFSMKLYLVKTISYPAKLILHTWPKDLEIGTSPVEGGFVVKMEMLEWLVPWHIWPSCGTKWLGLQSGPTMTKVDKWYGSLKISKMVLKDSETWPFLIVLLVMLPDLIWFDSCFPILWAHLSTAKPDVHVFLCRLSLL